MKVTVTRSIRVRNQVLEVMMQKHMQTNRIEADRGSLQTKIPTIIWMIAMATGEFTEL